VIFSTSMPAEPLQLALVVAAGIEARRMLAHEADALTLELREHGFAGAAIASLG
jgi:hypothetical protein